MKAEVNEVAAKVDGIRVPGHEGTILNARDSIEMAYADVQNEYKKLG